MIMSEDRFNTLISMGVEPITHNVDIEYAHYSTKKKKTRELRDVLTESCKYPYYVKVHQYRGFDPNKKVGVRKLTIYFFNKSDYSYYMMKTA